MEIGFCYVEQTPLRACTKNVLVIMNPFIRASSRMVKKHTFTYTNILIRFEMKELFDDIIRGLRPAQNRIMARLHFFII